MVIIDKNIDKINNLCEKHKVKQLYLFGSVLTDKFNDESDIDLLIRFGKVDILDYFDNYMDLKESLEKLLRKEVDLVEDQAIKNPIFRMVVDREKHLIYERKDA
jgi:predicted nucleotidyltransferase